jgi:hypothetical protein
MARECKITREEFARNAKPVEVTFRGANAPTAEAKEFSTGSMGWYANGKVTLDVGGQRVDCQVNVTITVIGSKGLPKDAPAKAAA